MTRTQADDTDAQLAITHALADVDGLRVDFDDVAEAVKYDLRNEHSSRSAFLRFSDTDRDTIEGTFITKQDGSYSQSAVDVKALAFLTGHEWGGAKNWESIWSYPDRREAKRRYEEENAGDMTWDEWWEESLQIWEDQIESSLSNCDSITFVDRETNRPFKVPVEVTE